MKLKDLLVDVEVENVDGSTNVKVHSITSDSRNVLRSSLFVAIKGENLDGHSFIPNAIKGGARAVVYQNKTRVITKLIKKESKDLTFIKVKDARKALAILASNFYDSAHKKMKIIGVTGTNGKTTTCELLYQLLNGLGQKTGVISTVMAKFPGATTDTGYHVTTPDALDLHKTLNRMYKSGCKYVIIETTSHGLDQHRTWGINYEISAVTNVTPEHLDYHKTFRKYLETKAKIFRQSKKVIFNKHDPALDKLLKIVPKDLDYKIIDYAKLKFPQKFKERFPGQYNLENASLAHAIVYELTGIDTINCFFKLKGIKGRMERIDTKKNFNVIIDFAHDAASLENALKVAREFTKNKLIVVFGCAGLRDKSKRPKMGFLATKLADATVITAEDPRTESLKGIIKEIESGARKAGGKKNKNYFVIEDRQNAIDFAINRLTQKGDVVLITGKGHEKSMCFGTTEYPWSDRAVVKKVLHT